MYEDQSGELVCGSPVGARRDKIEEVLDHKGCRGPGAGVFPRLI